MTVKSLIKQESLHYDPNALLVDAQKREKNITIFQNTIAKEQQAIKENRSIISQIDPNHADREVLEKNIEKRQNNIKTFEDAIQEEKEAIEKDMQMIAIIKATSV